MFKFIKIKNQIIIVIFTLLGLILRSIYNFDLIYWGDETFTFYISDPNISLKEFINRHKEIDDNPIIYFFIIRLLNFFTYSAEIVRISSILFGILTIPLSYIFFKNFFKDNALIFATFLITFNIFLIWQSTEARIASSLVFFCLINLIFFFRFLKKINKKNLFILFLVNLFILSYYPFFLTLIITQLIFIFLYKKKIFKIFLFSIFLTTLIYLIINYDYIVLKSSKISHIGILEVKFFFNFFFRSFFGSIIFGGVNLIIVILSLLFIKKKDLFLKFNALLIVTTYIFLIIYSILKSGIIVPRYFIFLIPSIIVFITNFFYQKKFLKYKNIYLVLTIINTIILLKQYHIQRPSINYLINNLDTKITKNYFVDEGELYENYFKNNKYLNTQLNFVKKENIKLYDKLFFICLNHPRMHVGTNKNIQDDRKCDFNNVNFKIINQKTIGDFKITLIYRFK
jgi:hypothetical protein